MNRQEIIAATAKLETRYDLLILLNRIKVDELGEKAHPFTIRQLNHFCHPHRNTCSYKVFTIPKKSGGFRTISAPGRLLLSLLTYTNRIFQAVYEAPSCTVGFVPGRSVVDNAKMHVGRDYVFNTDLQDFFPSITQARVWATLQLPPFSFNKTIANALAGLCCSEILINGEIRNALPQGAPTSPVLTNIICQKLDRRLTGLAKRFHVHYSRYADDITFSSDHDVYQEGGPFLTELKRIIGEQHFTINESKTRVQKKGARQEVTGLVVSDKVNVTREYVRGLDSLLYIWERYGRKEAVSSFLRHYTAKHNLKKQVPSMERVLRGRLMYMRMVKGEDDPVWRRLQRKFNGLSERETFPGNDVKYEASYRIEEFEQAIGTKVEFLSSGTESSTSRPSNAQPQAVFSLHGIIRSIYLSKYCKTRLEKVLDSGSEEEMDKFRKQCIISLCHRADDPDYHFWLIHRPGRVRSSITVLEILGADEVFHSAESAAKDILNKLIDSNFDLSVL